MEEVPSGDGKYRMDQSTHRESLSAAPRASRMLISRLKCHFKPDILLNASTECQLAQEVTLPRTLGSQSGTGAHLTGGKNHLCLQDTAVPGARQGPAGLSTQIDTGLTGFSLVGEQSPAACPQ